MSRLIVVVALLLAGCAPSETGDGDGGLLRFEDPENGVVCYQRYGGSAPLSCVQVRP